MYGASILQNRGICSIPALLHSLLTVRNGTQRE